MGAGLLSNLLIDSQFLKEFRWPRGVLPVALMSEAVIAKTTAFNEYFPHR